MFWNARYTTAALDHLHGTRPELVSDDTLLARLSPVSHAHINPLGRYRFDNPDTPPSGQLRPLRDPDNDDEPGVPTPPLGVKGDRH